MELDIHCTKIVHGEKYPCDSLSPLPLQRTFHKIDICRKELVFQDIALKLKNC